MIQTFDAVLPHGITLNCRSSGRPGLPVLVFVHGFPEAAFVWDALLEHFGDRYRCIAPNLRGFGKSSSPHEVEAYRAKHLVADLCGADRSAGGRPGRGGDRARLGRRAGMESRVAAARDDETARHRQLAAPRDLPARAPAQPGAAGGERLHEFPLSARCRGAALGENDFARLWPFFTNMGAADPSHPGGGWLTEAVRAQYREVWQAGLHGGCNYYRASPLRPPTATDDSVLKLQLPPDFCTVHVPTLVIWAEDDVALPVALLDGLDRYVPKLRLVRVPGATHWIVHERPDWVAAQIEQELKSA